MKQNNASNNNNDKLTKKEKLRVLYIGIYVLAILSLLVYGMTNPEFLEQIDKLLNTLYKVFDIF